MWPTLDLHGETADSARRLAEGWLRRQQAAGERTVRLITGRGRRSVGPPVLRGEMEDLLHVLGESLVERVEVESGGGALRVELRRLRPSPVPRPVLRDVDPELRRRAEESLVELGVAITPELLAAEIRRLKRE